MYLSFKKQHNLEYGFIEEYNVLAITMTKSSIVSLFIG